MRGTTTHASVTTKISLNSSDGWKVSEPTWIHRRAPDTVRPSTNTVNNKPRPVT
jgi:hypothetical protein